MLKLLFSRVVIWKKIQPCCLFYFQIGKRGFDFSWNALSFYGSQTFWAGSNFLCIPRNDLHIVPVPNFLCQTKRWFSYSKFSFCASTKLFGGALKFNSIFGLASNIWRSKKYFGSCRRTRKSTVWAIAKHCFWARR